MRWTNERSDTLFQVSQGQDCQRAKSRHMSLNLDAAKEIYRTFKAQNAETVYAVFCCERLYLGLEPAIKCRTCQVKPTNVELRSEADLDAVSLPR